VRQRTPSKSTPVHGDGHVHPLPHVDGESRKKTQEERHVDQVSHQQLPYFRAQEAGYGAGAGASLGFVVASDEGDLAMVKVDVANQEILVYYRTHRRRNTQRAYGLKQEE